nr:5'-nucleotidase-like [Onthophagus taurus]
MAHLLKDAREQYKSGEGPPVLYLDSGDIFSGSIWFSVHSYHGVAKILNALQPDAFNIGAHEFDVNIEGLVNFTNLAKFPIVSTNLIFHAEQELERNIKPSVVKVVDGYKVGILGYILPEMILWSEKGNVEVLDVISALKTECLRLRAQDVNVIIALSYGNFEIDKTIASAVYFIDVIIGTGSRTFLWNGVPPDLEVPVDSYPSRITRRDGSLALVAHSDMYLKYAGKINLRFTNDGTIKSFFGSPILMDSKILQDADMGALIEELRKDVLWYDQKVLSTCSVFLEGATCHYEECNFGNLIMDAIIESRASKYQGPGWTDAAIALMNSASLTTNVNSPQNDNKIFYGDIMRALPYSEMLYIVEIKGSDLLFVLEVSTAGLDASKSNQFLLMAGLKVMFDFKSSFGERVKLVKVRCAECDIPEYFRLDLDKRYKVIITSYLLKGGSGFTIIRDVVWNPVSIGERDTDVMIQYLQKVKYVIPEVGGRLIPYDKRLEESSFSFRSNLYCYCFLLVFMNFVIWLLK